MSILVNNDTRVLVQGITGSAGSFHTQQCMAYGNTNVVAGVVPGKGGTLFEGKVPIFDTVADNELLSILMFAGLAVLLSICSEADAFVAAGLPQFSLTSRLVFLVVGPVIDLKLVAMHAGIFGRRFAMVFAPVTLAVAVVSAVVVGQVVL